MSTSTNSALFELSCGWVATGLKKGFLLDWRS